MSDMQKAVEVLLNKDLAEDPSIFRVEQRAEALKKREADVKALNDAGLFIRSDDLPEFDTGDPILWKEGHTVIGFDAEDFILMRVDSRPTHPARARRIAYKILAAVEMTNLAKEYKEYKQSRTGKWSNK